MTDRVNSPDNAIELRLEAEMMSRGKEIKSPYAVLPPEGTRRVLHKLQVHQLELEMKNIELRLAQTKVDAMKERYFDLYDLAPVGYCTVCENGLILESNLTAANLLGVAKWVLFKQPFGQFILEEDRDIFYLNHKQLLKGREETAKSGSQKMSCELRMVKKDGTIFWAWLEAIVIQDSSASLEQMTDGQPLCRIVLLDITDRKGMVDVLKGSLTEKRELMREVHYQVKNNLANILVLLDLRMQRMDTNRYRAAFLEQGAMMKSMLLAHEHLYQSEDYSRIDFQNYIKDIISHICISYERSQDILITVDAKGVEMDLDSLFPCGLLITELVTNAFKFAFPEHLFRFGGDECRITVGAEWDGLAFTLVVADNGVGFPTDMDWTKTKTLGLLLVRMLGERQLNGRIVVDCTAGTSFRLRFVPRVR
jgi:PAS domain S-box-containing protein